MVTQANCVVSACKQCNNVAIEQLGNLNTWAEGEAYLNSLKTLYHWKENSEVVNYFYSLVKKRFA